VNTYIRGNVRNRSRDGMTERTARIATLDRCGYSATEIAIMVGVTTRTVVRHRARRRLTAGGAR
jgi:DNA-binding NarL/FixJ family response regulator